MEQPLSCIRVTMKSRLTTVLLIVMWLIVALILTTAYKSKLISSLINPRGHEYDNADKLVDLNYEFYVSYEYSVLGKKL